MQTMTDKSGNTFDTMLTDADVANATPSAQNDHDNGFTAVAIASGRCVRCGRIEAAPSVGGMCTECYAQTVCEDNGGGERVCPSCGETAWDDNDAECWACGAPMVKE
jgi:hypothetical protein